MKLQDIRPLDEIADINAIGYVAQIIAWIAHHIISPEGAAVFLIGYIMTRVLERKDPTDKFMKLKAPGLLGKFKMSLMLTRVGREALKTPKEVKAELEDVISNADFLSAQGRQVLTQLYDVLVTEFERKKPDPKIVGSISSKIRMVVSYELSQTKSSTSDQLPQRAEFYKRMFNQEFDRLVGTALDTADTETTQHINQLRDRALQLIDHGAKPNDPQMIKIIATLMGLISNA